MAVSDLIVSPVRVLTSAVGETLPATTLSYGGTWPAAWSEIAETATPLTVIYEHDNIDYDIQESIGPVNRKKTAERLRLETTLAGITLQNIVYAMQGDVSTTVVSSGVAAYEKTFGGDIVTLAQRAWGFEGQTDDGFPIRFFLFIGTSIAGASLEFGKASQTGIPIQIQGINNLSLTAGANLYRIDRITSAAGA